MANSLDLDPEFGAIELFEEVEQTFGIQVANAEAERCETVGDLYDVICAHSPDWDCQDGKCGSSMVFYRMRRSLSLGDKRGVTPETPLAGVGLEPSQLFKKLEVDTGLRLPGYELTWLGVTGGILMVGGTIAAVVALLTGHWIVSGIGFLVALAGLPFFRADPGRLPAGFATVADLVRRTVPLNATVLREAGGRPADRWAILTALAAEHGNLPPDKIGPETFFHRKSLELADGR